MPNRIIKESITSSETLAQLSDGEERHFYRLMVQADDYGRFDARPHVVRAKAYQAMLDRVSEKESERRTLRLESAGLIRLYEVDGKRYGYFLTWEKHQQVRAKTSKYPQPPSDEDSGYHMIAHDSTTNHVTAYAPVVVVANANENRESESLTEPECENLRAVAAASLVGQFTDAELGDLRGRFPLVDILYEAQKCVDWWAESRKPMKRPKSAFRNWLEKAKPTPDPGNGNSTYTNGLKVFRASDVEGDAP